MAKVKYPTLYVPKSEELSLLKFPSAGPHPNITGMRQKYWGQDAFIIKCGTYIYKVDEATYNYYRYCI